MTHDIHLPFDIALHFGEAPLQFQAHGLEIGRGVQVTCVEQFIEQDGVL